jgi:hypothetical protein
VRQFPTIIAAAKFGIKFGKGQKNYNENISQSNFTHSKFGSG